MSLVELFDPASVAVVGVGRKPGGVGRSVFDNLHAGGFRGEVWPVNPKASIIGRVKCYPSVDVLPGPADLVVVAVPAAGVIEVVRAAKSAGSRVAIVLSAGFKETGPAGAALERELASLAGRRFRILGPNCLGVISPHARLNASFAPSMPAAGGIAVTSQSGALGTAILDWAAGRGLGLSSFASLGNRCDITEADLLRHWAQDSTTRVVAGYMESVADGPAFISATRRLTARKPFVLVKAGTSSAGARAVSSHTGSLAGSEAAYDAAFRAAGALRVPGVEELFDAAMAFDSQPLPKGRGLAIVTNAGGPAILATDAAEREGVALASLSKATIRKLRAALPANAAVFNPVDVLGDADARRYGDALRAVRSDSEVHSVLVVLTPQAPTDAVGTAKAAADATAGRTTLACFMGDAEVSAGRDTLQRLGVPWFAFPERAIRTLALMEAQARHRHAPVPEQVNVSGDRDSVRDALAAARARGRVFVTENKAAQIAAAYGIPVPASRTVRRLSDALEAAGEIGYPVALKIASPDILHKSDLGAISLGITGPGELRSAYEAISSRVRARMPEAAIDGMLVQAMAPPGREVIIGVNRDPTFGPIIMFGLGGIYVEALKDVTFRLCPVAPVEARAMLTEIRASSILRGVRGEPAADTHALADVIVRTSWLAIDLPEIVELDINPLIVYPRGRGVLAADVRIGIGG